jgi:muramidase (phage lysozyme)
MTKNMESFLTMIAHSEGTLKVKGSSNGYDVLVGGTLFKGYSDHPRKVVTLNSKGLKSTAAGRYQILERYYDSYKRSLGLSDFGPHNQDKIAMQLIRECGATKDVEDGNISVAINKCKSRWASLPNAGYGQHENKSDDLIAFYKQSGGILA